MRICLIHPNYHSGGAEIAGNWPPAWVAYLAGSLKTAGFDDIHFIDAMTNDLTPGQLRVKLAELQPDVVGTTSITPLHLRGGGRRWRWPRRCCPMRSRSSAASTPPSCTGRS